MRIFVAHASAFDFRTKIYEPIRASALNTEHEFFLPQEQEIEKVTKELIQSCDAFVIDVSTPSTGAGIELGWADAFGIPLICMREKGVRMPSSVANVVSDCIEYENPVEMLEKLKAVLAALT